MSKTTLRAGTSPFAHLLSALSPRGRRAEQTDDTNKDGRKAEDGDPDPDKDEEARKARRAEEDEQRKEEDARRAEEDERRQEEDARRAEEDEKPAPDGKDAKNKKAEDGDGEGDGDGDDKDDEETEAKAEDDDDDDDMARARREGFAAAQARGRRIFSSPAAGKRPDVAAHLAFNETMSSPKAIGMLKLAANGDAPAAEGSRLGRRMARVVIPNPGTGGDGSAKEPSFGELAKAAAKKAGIIK